MALNHFGQRHFNADHFIALRGPLDDVVPGGGGTAAQRSVTRRRARLLQDERDMMDIVTIFMASDLWRE